jgi:hypothetical protein
MSRHGHSAPLKRRPTTCHEATHGSQAGVRTKNGAEFGVGPNVTPVGVALVLSAGMTYRAGVLNVPVNVAVVPSRSGVRVSVLSGFNIRQ